MNHHKIWQAILHLIAPLRDSIHGTNRLWRGIIGVILVVGIISFILIETSNTDTKVILSLVSMILIGWITFWGSISSINAESQTNSSQDKSLKDIKNNIRSLNQNVKDTTNMVSSNTSNIKELSTNMDSLTKLVKRDIKLKTHNKHFE